MPSPTVEPVHPDEVSTGARAGATRGDRSVQDAGLREDVHWLLARLARSFGVAEAEAVAAHGLSLRGYVVLTEIAQGPPRHQLAVARAAAVDRSLLVGVLDELERAGCVVRRPDPSDRRVRILEATPAGLQALGAATAAIRGVEQRLLTALEPARREDFLRVLQDLAAAGAEAGFDTQPCV